MHPPSHVTHSGSAPRVVGVKAQLVSGLSAGADLTSRVDQLGKIGGGIKGKVSRSRSTVQGSDNRFMESCPYVRLSLGLFRRSLPGACLGVFHDGY